MVMLSSARRSWLRGWPSPHCGCRRCGAQRGKAHCHNDSLAATIARSSATDASGRASWGGGAVGAVTIVDAFSASGVTTTSDATAAAPSGGFVVANPLRHAAKVSGGRGGGGADSNHDAPAESMSGAAHGASRGDRGDGSGSGSGAGEQLQATSTSLTVSASKRSGETPRTPNQGKK
jgi:hypothetical protein